MGWVAGQKCTRGYTLQSGPEGPSWCRGVGVGRFRTTMHQTCILTASLTTAAVYSSDASSNTPHRQAMDMDMDMVASATSRTRLTVRRWSSFP